MKSIERYRMVCRSPLLLISQRSLVKKTGNHSVAQFPIFSLKTLSATPRLNNVHKLRTRCRSQQIHHKQKGLKGQQNDDDPFQQMTFATTDKVAYPLPT